MADKSDEKALQPIIVKKIVKGGGHHGGAWKVAYADFVTAMMAFFLLLWLLNVTTDEQKNAISTYFDPTHPKVSEATGGAGGVLGGLSMSKKGSMATSYQNMNPPVQAKASVNERTKKEKDTTNKKASADSKALEAAKEILRKKEEQRFKDAEDQLKKAIQSDPELAALSKNLMIDVTPEGMRIQIVDQEGEPMFASGSAEMLAKTRKLMGKVSEIIRKMPNEISIRGHTDSVPYGKDAKYTNWELSTDRANATRRVLLEDGVPLPRVNNVVGKADTDHLIPDKPADPRNRRISIILLKEELTDPDFDEKAAAETGNPANEPPQIEEPVENEDEDPGVPVGTFRKTPGSVQFP